MSHDLNQILTNHKKIQSKKAAKEMCPDMEAKIQIILLLLFSRW